jgi:transcriptional regulator with XRE-family HTH domain
MSPSIKKSFAAEIRKLRKKRDYTQQELAARAELEYKYIQRIEGKNPPNLRLETAEKLANALSLKLSAIIKKTEL